MTNWKTMLGAVLALGIGTTAYKTYAVYKNETHKQDTKKTNPRLQEEIRLKLVGMFLNIKKLSDDERQISESPFFREREEASLLADEISEEISGRDKEIEALADKYYRMFRCKIGGNSESADYWRHEIRIIAGGIEVLCGERNDPSILARELEKFKRSRLDINEDQPSIGHHLAKARYFERCLEEASGEDTSGLFDMYQDYRKAKFARECEEAAILADAMGFADERFDTILKCVPKNSTDYKKTFRDNFLNFLEDVKTVDESALALSARYLGYEQQNEWVMACTTNRIRTHLYGTDEAKAQCFADIIRAYDRSGFVPFLDFELEEIARMSSVLNDNNLMSESGCYLDAYLFGSHRRYVPVLSFDEPSNSQDYLALCLAYTRLK